MTYSNDLLFVAPVLTETEATARLMLRSYLPPFSKLEMEKVEVAFLPHYHFSIMVEWKSREEAVEAVVDAVLGHFALWRPDQVSPEPAPDMEFEIPFLLDEKEARERLMKEYRWLLISTSLKLRRGFKVRRILPGPRIYYPFWTGYYCSRNRWNMEVVDAINGMRQGGKVRDALLAGWLR